MDAIGPKGILRMWITAQVVDVVALDIEYLTQHTFIYSALDYLRERIEATDQTSHDPQAGLAPELDDPLNAHHLKGHWLLDEDVLASLERPNRVLPVERVGNADGDHVDVVPLEDPEVGVDVRDAVAASHPPRE